MPLLMAVLCTTLYCSAIAPYLVLTAMFAQRRICREWFLRIVSAPCILCYWRGKGQASSTLSQALELRSKSVLEYASCAYIWLQHLPLLHTREAFRCV